MNKWFLRLVGVLILGVLAMLFYDVWFRPTVPDTLQDEISLQVGEQSHNSQQNTQQGQHQNNVGNGQNVNMPEVPNIELTSLEDQNEPAVLTNPQTPVTPVQPTGTVIKSDNTSTDNTPPAAQPDVSQGASWVQVGSFADNENAQKMVAQMRQKQWPTDTEVANVNGKSYHRVFVGPLAASDVPQYLQRLSEMGINAREVSR